MKKVIAFCTVALSILFFSGCSLADVPDKTSSESQISSDIRGYFIDNLDYTPKDLRIVEEDNGTFFVGATLGTEYSIDDFVSYAEQMIQISESAETKFKINFSSINPSLYTGDNAWIGWSNDSLNFYDQDKYLVKNVSLNMLKNEVEKYKTKNGYSNSEQESSLTSPTLSYNEMKFEIEQYLSKHNDTSKMYKNVEVKYNIEKVRFNIEVQSYETYTFASIVNAATTAVEKIVNENNIEDYCLWVYSPTDAKYKVSWISFNLKSGILDDKGYTDDYNETIRLEKMLKRYGYED